MRNSLSHELVRRYEVPVHDSDVKHCHLALVELHLKAFLPCGVERLELNLKYQGVKTSAIIILFKVSTMECRLQNEAFQM